MPADQMDGADLQVFRHAAAGVAEEMNTDLVRSAHSPNITDRRDCSCAVFDADGALATQAENIPVHLGAMPFSVAAALEEHPLEELEEGDGVLLNDPYSGGAHLPDLTLVSPVHVDGDVVAVAANRAHHSDVGGATRGSVASEARDVQAEGLVIPPVRLVRGGAVDEDVMATVLANTRTPGERRGDLRAQVAANATARRRVADLVDRFGVDGLRDGFVALQDYGERRTRAAIDKLPDGRYAADDVLDGDGAGTEDVGIDVAVTVDGGDVTLDFAGTDPQVAGPINAPFAVTASACYYAVRCVTDPDVPPSAGSYRAIHVEAPEGSVVNAAPPAPVVAGNLEVSQRTVDVVLAALAEAVPGRVPAGSQGTMNNVTFGDRRGAAPDGAGDGGRHADDEGAGTGLDGDRDAFAFYETVGGGHGAAPGTDGMSGVHVHMSNTRNTPAEVLETRYPLRLKRYVLRPDSGGAGRHRGGLGVRRDVEALAPVECSLLGDRRRHAPRGLAGGRDAATGADLVDRGDGFERVDAKTTLALAAGDVVSVRTPGGGGYGDPAERDRATVLRDLRRGLVTPGAARERYDVEPEETEKTGDGEE